MKNNLLTALTLGFFLLCRTQSLEAFTLNTIDVPSDKMAKNIAVSVILPEASKNELNKLPVLYLLHGFGDDNNKWPQSTSIGELSDQYGVIVICPDGGHSWYFDSPEIRDSQYETFVSSELVSYVDSHYRTVPERTARAIAGLSMGGHGALFLAIRHQDVFGAVASLSGGVDIRPFPGNWDISKSIGTIQAHPERWNELTVINLAKKLKNGDLAISIDCGTSDFFIDVNRALHKQLLSQKVGHDYSERPGQHEWAYWRNSIKYQMLFFSDYFKKNADATTPATSPSSSPEAVPAGT